MKSQLTTGLAGAPNFGTPHAMPISCYYHGHGIIYFNVLILWFFVIFCEFWSSKKASKLVVDLPIAWCLEFGNQGDCSWAPSTTHNIWTKCLLKLWLGTLNKRRSQLSNPQKKILSSLANECNRGNLAAQFWAECWHTFHQIIFLNGLDNYWIYI